MTLAQAAHALTRAFVLQLKTDAVDAMRTLEHTLEQLDDRIMAKENLRSILERFDKRSRPSGKKIAVFTPQPAATTLCLLELL